MMNYDEFKFQMDEIITLLTNEDTFLLGVNMFKKKIDFSLYKCTEESLSFNSGRYLCIYWQAHHKFFNSLKLSYSLHSNILIWDNNEKFMCIYEKNIAVY